MYKIKRSSLLFNGRRNPGSEDAEGVECHKKAYVYSVRVSEFTKVM